MYIVYILRTNRNTLYTGITNNLENRLEQHRKGKGAKYLRSFDSFELVYTENWKTKSEALKRELQIKKLTKREKEGVITGSLTCRKS